MFKDRSWGPAIGYYELASRVYTESGAGHHQMAVIAQLDSNPFDATYYLYRALVVANPHEATWDNLQTHFRDIIDSSQVKELGKCASPAAAQISREDLIFNFLLLHALCCMEPHSAKCAETEAEYLRRLELALAQRSLEVTVTRMILINLAAEYHATGCGDNKQALPTKASSSPLVPSEDPECKVDMHRFLVLVRLNVRTFHVLLQKLQLELNRSVRSSETAGCSEKTHEHGKLSTKLRRIVLWVRQYSAWLLSQANVLAAASPDSSLNSHAAELGALYARTLELLRSSFIVIDLPSPEYLLEEDEQTIGFLPLDSEHEHIKERYYIPDYHARKPHWHDKGIRRLHPTSEMLSRIRDLILDGFYLVRQQVDQLRQPVSYLADGVLGRAFGTGRESSSRIRETGSTSDADSIHESS